MLQVSTAIPERLKNLLILESAGAGRSTASQQRVPHLVHRDPIEARKRILLPGRFPKLENFLDDYICDLTARKSSSVFTKPLWFAAYLDHVKSAFSQIPVSNELLTILALKIRQSPKGFQRLPNEIFVGNGGEERKRIAVRYALLAAAGGKGSAHDVQELKGPSQRLVDAGLKSLVNEYSVRQLYEVAWEGYTEGEDPIIPPWFLDRVPWHRPESRDLLPRAAKWLVTIAEPVYNEVKKQFDAKRLNNTDWYSVLNRLGFAPLMTANKEASNPVKLIAYAASAFEVPSPFGPQRKDAKSWKVLGQVRNKWRVEPLLIDDVTDAVVHEASKVVRCDLTKRDSFNADLAAGYVWTNAFDRMAEGALKYSGMQAAFALGRRFDWWFGVGENQIPHWLMHYEQKWEGYGGWNTARQAAAWSLGLAGVGTLDAEMATWSCTQDEFESWCRSRRSEGKSLVEHLTAYRLSNIHRQLLNNRNGDFSRLLIGLTRDKNAVAKANTPVDANAETLFAWEGGMVRVNFSNFGLLCKLGEERRGQGVLVSSFISPFDKRVLPVLGQDRGAPLDVSGANDVQNAMLHRLNYKLRGLCGDKVHSTKKGALLERLVESVGRRKELPAVTEDDVQDLITLTRRFVLPQLYLPTNASEYFGHSLNRLLYATYDFSVRREGPSRYVRLALLKNQVSQSAQKGDSTLDLLDLGARVIGRGAF